MTQTEASNQNKMEIGSEENALLYVNPQPFITLASYHSHTLSQHHITEAAVTVLKTVPLKVSTI